MEKALIKEIEKIIDQKEPKQILKKLWKLTKNSSKFGF